MPGPQLMTADVGQRIKPKTRAGCNPSRLGGFCDDDARKEIAISFTQARAGALRVRGFEISVSVARRSHSSPAVIAAVEPIIERSAIRQYAETVQAT